jgi:hypothetical protein
MNCIFVSKNDKTNHLSLNLSSVHKAKRCPTIPAQSKQTHDHRFTTSGDSRLVKAAQVEFFLCKIDQGF